MKRALSIVLLLACSGFAGPEPFRPDAKVHLSPNLTPGREFHVTWTWKLEDTWFERGQSTSDQHMGIAQIMGWLFQVEKRDKDGTTHMKLTWSRLGIGIDFGEQKIGYDSLAHDPRNPLALVCAPVVGGVCTFKIDSKGTVSDVKGMDAIREKVESYKPNEQLYSMVKPFLENDSLAFLLRQYFSYYSFEDVHIGSTWKRVIESEDSTCEFAFKVTGINLSVGRPTVIVEYEGKHVDPPGKKGDSKEADSAARDVKSFELEGTLLFDARSMELLEGNEEEEMVYMETIAATESEPEKQMRVVHSGEQVVTNDPPILPATATQPAGRDD